MLPWGSDVNLPNLPGPGPFETAQGLTPSDPAMRQLEPTLKVGAFGAPALLHGSWGPGSSSLGTPAVAVKSLAIAIFQPCNGAPLPAGNIIYVL